MAEQLGRAPRFTGVDGVRGIAAFGVLLSHVYLYSSPEGRRHELGWFEVVPATSGAVGVVLFFTLSGFLLYRPFAAAMLDGRRPPSVRSYLRNRFLRVLPGYWFALLGAGLVLRTTYLPALEVEGRPLTSDPTAFAANAFLLQGYHPSTLLTGIGPAWSLSVELVFYLALPLLAAGAAFLSSRTGPGGCRPWCAALVPAGLLLLLGQIGWRLAAALPSTEQGSWAGSWHAVVARSFLAHAGLFAMGLVLAVLHAQLERGAVRLPAGWRLVSALGAVSLIAVAALALDRHRLSENHATLAMSAGAACLLALVVLDGGNRLVHVLSSRLLHSAGLISYGIFLWNEPVVWFLRRQGWTSTGVDGFLLALLMTSVLAATLALLSWRLVERPAMALKRAGGGRVRPTDVPGSTAAVIASAVPSPRRSSVSSDDRLATD